MVETRIQYARTQDGTKIAYSAFGTGRPLVITSWCFTNLSEDSENPAIAPFYKALGEQFNVVRYDRRGMGLSDRERTDYSLEADVADLASLVDHLDLSGFALMGNCHLGPASIVYAYQHPERVSHLILHETYADGPSLARTDVKTSLTAMVRSHWGIASRTMADFAAPGLPGELLEDIAHIFRDSVTGDVAANLLDQAYATDVTELLPALAMPTVVVHRRGSRAAPFHCARDLASLIPGARLVTLEGSVHLPWLGDPDAVVDAIVELVEGHPSTNQPSPPATGMTAILFLDVADSTALTSKLGDVAYRQRERELDTALRRAVAQAGARLSRARC